MRYYVIAGEASGDLHGSNLVRMLKIKDPSAVIRSWGGNLMEIAGAEVVKNYRDLAFMGFIEVVKNLDKILKNLSFAKSDILAFKPDAIILIDYPGFNLRIAKWAKSMGIKTIYYISPQVWAWKEGRVKEMRKTIDKMIVILPFEKEFYRKWEFKVDYVGHPLVEVIEDWKESNAQTSLSEKPIIALLPGSRKQEILKKLPIMLETAALFPDYQFFVAKAPGQQDEFYTPLLSAYSNVSSVRDDTYNLLNQSVAALVTSGTATLETALFGVPEVVCYKGSPISYWIARQVIKVKYISLVNLIMDKQVVKELIQAELTVINLQKELGLLLNNEDRKRDLQTEYDALRNLLRKGGKASGKAAEIIYNFTNQR